MSNIIFEKNVAPVPATEDECTWQKFQWARIQKVPKAANAQAPPTERKGKRSKKERKEESYTTATTKTTKTTAMKTTALSVTATKETTKTSSKG